MKVRVKHIVFTFFCITNLHFSIAQTCHFIVSGSYNKDNYTIGTDYTCDPGYDLNSTGITIYIDPGVELTIENTGGSKTITWQASVIVQGTLVLQHQLVLGDASPTCAYTLTVEEGGFLQSGNGNDVNEQLIICDQLVLGNGNGGTNPLWQWDEIGEPVAGPVVVDDTGGTLPVELLSFTANPAENGIILQWSTASEMNNDFFTLERSRNGKDFEVIAQVEGNGTSHVKIDYSFADRNPYLGLSYYQLSQTDYDGTKEIFPVISTIYTSNKIIEIYPNPIRDYISVRASDKAPNEKIHLNIYNIQGNLILKKNYFTDALGNLNESIQLDHAFEKGIYLIELKSSNTRDIVKVQKE